MKSLYLNIRRYRWAFLIGTLLPAAVAVGYIFDLINVRSFLLFHTSVEISSAVIGFTIFSIAWNTRRFLENRYLMVLGAGYLFVSLLDLAHALAYKGLGVFPVSGSNLAVQLWISARYLEVSALLLAPLLGRYRIGMGPLVAGFGAAGVALVLSIYPLGWFPMCFDDQAVRLTAFKIIAEFLLVGLLSLALLLLLRMKRYFSRSVLWLISGSIVITMMSELAFVLYQNVYGPASATGHALKIFSVYLIYKALVETSLSKPYEVLFRNLKQSQHSLQKARDNLEQNVRQRTKELSNTIEQLETEVRERMEAQQALSALKDQFASFMRYVPGLAFIKDQLGRYIYVNEAFTRTFGWPEDRCLNKTDSDLWPQELANKLRQEDLFVMSSGQMMDRLVELPTAAGTMLFWTCRFPIYRPALSPLLGGVALDVTERQQAEQAIRVGHRFLELAFRYKRIDELLGVYAEEICHLVDCRASAILMLSERKELSHLAARGFPENFAPFEQSWSLDAHGWLYPDLQTDKSQDAGRVMRTEHGSVWFNPIPPPAAEKPAGNDGYLDACRRHGFRTAALVPIRDSERTLGMIHLADGREGQIRMQAVGVLEAASLHIGLGIQKLEAEGQLTAERSRLYSLLNMLPGYVTLKTKDYGIRFANNKYVELFGQGNSKPCYQIQARRDDPCPGCPIHRILDTGQPEDWEWSRPDGKIFHVWGYPFKDQDGSRLVLEMGADITQQKNLERKVIHAGEIERRNIGHILHDTLGQNLTGLAMLIKSLTGKIHDVLPEEQATAEQIISLVNEAVSQVRSLAHGLDPVGLEKGGWISGLKELTASVERLFGIPCDLYCQEGSMDLADDAASQAYYIAQEAVNNAVKHSHASRICINIEYQDHFLVLHVEDNGVGINQDSYRHKGMGLRIMRYRAAAVGGGLQIRHRIGGGTIVSCLLPAAKPAAEDFHK